MLYFRSPKFECSLFYFDSSVHKKDWIQNHDLRKSKCHELFKLPTYTYIVRMICVHIIMQVSFSLSETITTSVLCVSSIRLLILLLLNVVYGKLKISNALVIVNFIIYLITY